MKKNIIYSLAATFITAALAMGSFTACSNEDIVADQQTATQGKTYTVSIPASMGSDGTTRAVDFSGTDPVTGKPTAVSSFKTTDKIYVYNQTKDAMLTGYLTPSADGKTSNLTGSLTGTIAAGDELVLLYNLSNYNSKPARCCFEYALQDGTQAGVTDGAMATVTASIDNDQLTTATAHFQNVQSMFRFQFTSNGTPLSVKSLKITPKINGIAMYYYPLDDADKYVCHGGIFANLSSATTDPIYLALCIDENECVGVENELTFDVVDATGKLYTTTKAAPSGGFQNGKYYYNTTPIDLGASVLQLVKPTLSRSDGGYDSELADANALRCFQIYSPSKSGAGTATGINISMSGTSTGYWFSLLSDAGNTVNMSGLTATFDESSNCIDTYKSLTLNISGDNTITCKNYDYCVSSSDNLKLSGNGTLTVTANSTTDYGLSCKNYNGSNVSALAADGYTVTRSDMTNNGNSTYTWTYTVAPAYFAVTNGDIGKVIGADGKIYDNADAATTAGTTAEAMIAFVGTIDGVCEHGLAISLTDVYQYNATFAEATGDAIISSWATYHPIEGGTWRLPSEADWQRMMWGYYTETPAAINISIFQTNLGTVGTALVDDAYYWTSTGVDTENAKTVLYDAPYAGIQSVAKTGYCHVRACLAF